MFLFPFFFSFLLVSAFGVTHKRCCCIFSLYLSYAGVTNIRLINMICPVLSNYVLLAEINSNSGFKREHVKSCYLTTKNIISLLPHGNMEIYHDRLSPIESHGPLIDGFSRSRDKINLYESSAYRHQTW